MKGSAEKELDRIEFRLRAKATARRLAPFLLLAFGFTLASAMISPSAAAATGLVVVFVMLVTVWFSLARRAKDVPAEQDTYDPTETKDPGEWLQLQEALATHQRLVSQLKEHVGSGKIDEDWMQGIVDWYRDHSRSQLGPSGCAADHDRLLGELTKLFEQCRQQRSLRTDENFLALRVQLREAELRIRGAKHTYNEVARERGIELFDYA